MAKVIPLGEPVELRDDGRNVPGASTRHGSARVYDLAERRAASRIEELAARELALRAQRLGALDGPDGAGVLGGTRRPRGTTLRRGFPVQPYRHGTAARVLHRWPGSNRPDAGDPARGHPHGASIDAGVGAFLNTFAPEGAAGFLDGIGPGGSWMLDLQACTATGTTACASWRWHAGDVRPIRATGNPSFHAIGVPSLGNASGDRLCASRTRSTA
jgi:hypothetical protein